MTCLKVFIGKDALVSRVDRDVWINIREIWNVDLGVRVAVLGQAEHETFAVLLERVKRLFCVSLGDADLVSPVRHRSSAGTADRQERRPSFAERLAGQRPLFRN